MRILGIDPGSVICGYGVVEKEGNSLTLVEYGVIKAKKKNEDFPMRLKEIYTRLISVIERTLPDEAAIESTFYSKNVKSLVQLTHARAVAMLAATMREIPIVEYSPLEVKKSVTGMGRAQKEQVGYMMRKMLNITETPEFLDSTDALAIAVCHLLKRNSPVKKSNSWGEFIKNNPDRIIS
jgi:crossover junction endodeoxyribonuclease RuvC